MKVLATWEFEVDTSDFDNACVDIYGLAKDLTQKEIEWMLEDHQLTAEDFEYQIEDEPEYGCEDSTEKYNPVERAYQSLVNVFHTKKKPPKANMELAIEEAIGYLGEALK